VFVDSFANVPVEGYQLAIGGKDSPALGLMYPGFYVGNNFKIFGIVYEHGYITFPR
jgi:hypothetical protein